MSGPAKLFDVGEVAKPKPGVRFLVVADGKEFELLQVRATVATDIANPEQSILNLAAAIPTEAAVAIITSKRKNP